MQLSEFNQTKSSIEALIFSSEVINCAMACEILRGVNLPNGIKIDIVRPILDAFFVMVRGLLSIGSKATVSKATVLLEKVDIINEFIEDQNEY